jgi:hypothetical protein
LSTGCIAPVPIVASALRATSSPLLSCCPRGVSQKTIPIPPSCPRRCRCVRVRTYCRRGDDLPVAAGVAPCLSRRCTLLAYWATGFWIVWLLMPPLRQRLVLAAIRFRLSSRSFTRREAAAIQRLGPVHRALRQLYLFSRRHPVSVNQWDVEYAEGDYAERLDTITHVAHHMVILGYLTYGAKAPTVLDVGCGHGRFLELLAGFDFAEYVGVDWSARGVERATSLLVPHTRFEVADMNKWDTTERFDVIVLNNCLMYSIDVRQMFERALGWLAKDGFVIAAMHRGLGARYIWSRVESAAVEQLAACAVKDDRTGAIWDVKALRPRPASLDFLGAQGQS